MRTLNILIEFELGELVYLKTDVDQKERLVTGIQIEGNGNIVYHLSLGEGTSRHYGFEMTADLDVLKTTKGN